MITEVLYYLCPVIIIGCLILITIKGCECLSISRNKPCVRSEWSENDKYIYAMAIKRFEENLKFPDTIRCKKYNPLDYC
jgi:hypothetical protein